MADNLESILTEISKVDNRVNSNIYKLLPLVSRYKIRWVYLNNKVLFSMTDVCNGMGYASDYYKDTIVRDFNRLAKLKGKHYKLSGAGLKLFKQAYRDKYKEVIKASTLWAGDWLRVWSLIDEVGIKSATKSIDKPLPKVIVTEPSSQSFTSEEDIVDNLMGLAGYSSLMMRREVSVRNTIDSKTKSRRYDIVQTTSKEIIVYEVKKNMITTQEINDTLGEKGYLHLARDVNKVKKSRVVFISPRGITLDARRILDLMSDVSFLSVQDLAEYIISVIRKDTKKSCSDALWYVDKIKEKFPLLFR